MDYGPRFCISLSQNSRLSFLNHTSALNFKSEVRTAVPTELSPGILFLP